MQGYNSYQTFLALRNHFNTNSYDFFKYNGKVRTTRESFETKKDRIWFEKLEKRYSEKDAVSFFISNFLVGRKWIINMMSHEAAEAEQTFKEYQKRQESFSYYFEEDLTHLLNQVSAPSDLFKCPKNEFPLLMLSYLRKDISLDTLVVLDDYVQYTKKFDAAYKDSAMWEEVSRMIRKYRPFVKYDPAKIRKILEKQMLNNS